MSLKRSFPPIAAADARLLVLGSLPGDRSLAEHRYYAHPQNQFWALLSGPVGRDLVSLGYDDRLAALRDAKVALWDVIGSARRVGSTDAAIVDANGNAVAELVATLPDLRAIAFNGGTAAKLGLRQGLGKLGLEIVALPSSSPLHTVGRTAKQPVWDTLAAFLTSATLSSSRRRDEGE